MEDNKRNRSIELCRRVVTTESLIEEAREIYGDLYDYSKVKYINGEHKVTVVCSKHGDFDVFAREHLDGKGCPKCKKGEIFLQKIIEKFGDVFGTEQFIYENSTTPVTLVCKHHGVFRKTPNSLLSTRFGCPECGNEYARQLQEKSHTEAEAKKAEDKKQREKFLEDLEIICRTQNSLCNLKSKEIPDSFIGIDFETLYCQRVSACSVGMVKYKNGEIVDRYYSLIKPPFDYPDKKGEALTWIHGFTEEMLVNERTFDEIIHEMEIFAEGLPLVAHNASVEKACIYEATQYYNINTTLDYENIIDTYPLSKQVEFAMGLNIEGRGTHTLDTVCKRFDVPRLHHHNALDDAEMCGNLLLVFKRISNETQILDCNLTIKTTKSIDPTIKKGPKINQEDKIQRTDLENVADNPFKNKVIVLTGFSKGDSQDYAHRLNELGAIIKDSVNGKTNILITGYNAGPSKLQKAEALGTQIMSESKFLEILKSL